MLPQKHKGATKFKYNSGFFITTNILPDFGQNLDGDAVYKRLEVFETKALEKKDLTVTGRKRYNFFISIGDISKDVILFLLVISKFCIRRQKDLRFLCVLSFNDPKIHLSYFKWHTV